MSPAKRAFITAVDSFTGRYLAVELESHGYEVFGTTRRPGRDARYEACDINDREQLEKMFRRTRPDVIFHLAAITFTESDTARDVYTANLLGPLSLLEAISASGITCRKLLLVSSAHVYGNQLRSPITEDFSTMPASDYAVSKLALEYLASLWFSRLPLIVVRPFNFTGAGQSLRRLLPKIVDHYARRADGIELGNLEIARDFSDVRDVVASYRLLAECHHHSKIVNVCSGRSYSIGNILDYLNVISGHAVSIHKNPDLVRENDVKALWGGNERLKTLIEPVRYRPIEETLQWMYSSALASCREIS